MLSRHHIVVVSLAASLLSVGLSACGGLDREPDMLKIRQSGDGQKDCVQLKAEIYDHHLRSGDQARRAIDVERRNVYLGFAVPFSLSMDLTGRERRNAKQHRQRRDYLKRWFDRHGCIGYVGF